MLPCPKGCVSAGSRGIPHRPGRSGRPVEAGHVFKRAGPVWLLRVGVPGPEERLGPRLAGRGVGQRAGGQRLPSRLKTGTSCSRNPLMRLRNSLRHLESSGPLLAGSRGAGDPRVLSRFRPLPLGPRWASSLLLSSWSVAWPQPLSPSLPRDLEERRRLSTPGGGEPGPVPLGRTRRGPHCTLGVTAPPVTPTPFSLLPATLVLWPPATPTPEAPPLPHLCQLRDHVTPPHVTQGCYVTCPGGAGDSFF